jgi:ribonuclease P protein component
VVKGRRIYLGRSLVAFSRQRQPGGLRVGVAVSRQLKGSVLRNRARRRLREAARLQLLALDSDEPGLGIPFDVVLIARTAALTLPLPALEADVSAVRARLQERLRADRSDHANRSDRSDHANRSDRSDHANRSDRGTPPERPK